MSTDAAKPEKPKTVLSELKMQLLLLEKVIANKDIKQIQKISNTIRRLRKSTKSHHLAKLFATFLPSYQIDFSKFKDFDPNFNEEIEINKTAAVRLSKIIEIEIYLSTLFLIYLVCNKYIDEAARHAQEILKLTISQNKRYLDALLAIQYFFLSRAYEMKGELRVIRELLLEGFRNACKVHDENGQAILINLILRNYLHYNQYEQSFQFLNKTEFPEHASGNEQARYLYYTGLIHAIRGEYQDAYQRITQAIRKAPDNTALGFKLQANRLNCLIELLLGLIPNRDVFTQIEMQAGLYPYYRIVSTVIKGDLKDFSQEVQKFESQFQRDRFYNIIQRLPQIVIRGGLRRINMSYSKISLQDIAEKLKLPIGSNSEQIVAKAIRDGTLNATIDHEKQIVQTKELNDLYGTTEPQEAFGRRIVLCQNLYNQAVKALQFQNLQYDYGESQNPDELTAEELINLVDMAGEF